MRANPPSISIVSVNFNADLIVFENVLKSIQFQKYPKEKIEHIVVDGGSNNGSIELAKKYGCKVLIKENLKFKAEERQFMGLVQAKNEILAIIETDNVLPDMYWLNHMVEPFLSSEKVFCTYNAFNCVERTMSLLTRYCGLFGVSDPVLHYLGKSEKIPWYKTLYSKGTILKYTKNYSIVRFSKKDLPTLGDNGCLIRKEIFGKTTMNQKNFVHLDLFMELLNSGYDTYGVVHNCIAHISGASITNMIKRRLHYHEVYTDRRRQARKYLVYDPQRIKDTLNILRFILFTITIIEPLFQSTRGYLKKRDSAWFLHPIMCWIFFISYSKYELFKIIKKQ